MELDKFHVLVRKTSPGHHSGSVTGASVSGGGAKVGLSVSAAGQDGVLGPEPVDGAVLQAHGDDTHAFALLHQEIESKVFNKVVTVISEKTSDLMNDWNPKA